MNEVVTELSKPVWWISVVVAGILINLVSSYLKSSLDLRFERLSGWARKRSDVRRSKWQSRVARARSSDRALQAEWQEEIRCRVMSLSLFLSGFSGGIAALVYHTSVMTIPSFMKNIILAGLAFAFFAGFLLDREAVTSRKCSAEALEDSN